MNTNPDTHDLLRFIEQNHEEEKDPDLKKEKGSQNQVLDNRSIYDLLN